VRVTIEVPRLGFVKREVGGGIDYVSPLPCPWNYGCVRDIPAPDGDPLDAVVLGPRLAAGSVVEATVRGVVRFRDRGAADDKLVCGDHAPSLAERRRITAFFRFYASVRRSIDRLRGRSADTRFVGFEVLP
jgi:inorganic pyrophosphatase